MLHVLFLTVWACMISWGAGHILTKLTKYGHISRRNVYLKNVVGILPQIFERVRSEKSCACLRILVITLVTFLLAGAFQSKLDAQTYALLLCAAIVIALFSYDLRLSFIYGLLFSAIGMCFLLRDRFSEKKIVQSVTAMFEIPAEQALTIILGCALIGAVILLFSIIYRIWFIKSTEALDEEVTNTSADMDSSYEAFLGRIYTIVAHAGIPISCFVSGILVKIF